MKSINASYKIILPMSIENMLKHIERCGRLCYRSEGNATGDSWKTWASSKVKAGHQSVLEHIGFTVLFTNDRGFTHEIVRHRIASFSQESTRYCNYMNDKFGNEIKVVAIDKAMVFDKTMRSLPPNRIDAILHEWEHAMWNAQESYNKIMEYGATAQFARSVLPNSTCAEIAVTANMREWISSIVPLRSDDPAHPQMREVMIPLLLDLQHICPQLFGHIKVGIIPAWYKFDPSRITIAGEDEKDIAGGY